MKKLRNMVNWEPKAIGENLDLESMKEVLDAEGFECHVLWPSSWRMQARWLMRSAIKILQDYAEAFERVEKRDMEETESWLRGENVTGSRILQGQELEDEQDTQTLLSGLLLVGYAIENQLKGIIFSQNPELLNENLELDRRFTRHELDTLYCAAGFAENPKNIDDETRKILEGLTQIILWRGRYLFPLDFRDSREKKLFPCNTPRDIEKLIHLYVKLDTKLSQIPIPSTHKSKRVSGK
jgi:hypothetical protein